MADKDLIATILDENQERVNRVAAILLFGAASISVISVALNVLGVFKLGQYVSTQRNLVPVIFCVIPLLAGRFGRFDGRTQKWINLVCIIVFVAWTDYVVGYNSSLFMAVPIIMAALYFSEKTTVASFVMTIIAFAGTSYFGAKYNGLYDNNHAPVPDGTVLEIEGSLKKTLLEYGFRNSEYIHKMFLLGYVPKLLMLSLILVLAIAITRFGHDMLVKQAGITAEQTKVNTELALAGKLQASALPPVESINGKYNFEIAAGMKAARETGGDFYDFSMIDDTHLALVIADVSDKGVPAAMFMMSAKEKLHSAFASGKSPGEILRDVNNELCVNNERNMFVTVWLGILDISSGQLIAANGGHECPLWQKAGSEFVKIEDEHGTMLGVFEGNEFPEYEMKLGPGDVLLQYTDGVTEARNENDEMYGIQRLLDGLNKELAGKQTSVQDVSAVMKEQTMAFVKDAEQSDDITMLALKML